MPVIMTLMPMFATYRVKVKRIIFFVKIKDRYFKRKECFSVAPGLKFWRQFYENQGCKNWEKFLFMLQLQMSAPG